MQKCPDCHSLVDDDAIYCDQCGYQLRSRSSAPIAKPQPVEVSNLPESAEPPAAPQRNCPACGYINQPGDPFCANCGVSLIMTTAIHEQKVGEAQLPVPAVSKPAASITSCPTCGASNPPGELYCQNCGFSLAMPAGSPPQSMPGPSPQLASPTPGVQVPPVSPRIPVVSTSSPSPFETVSASRQVGRLFSTATNSNFPIPALPQIIIGRRDPDKGIYPDVDLSAQGSTSNSVSRQHARLLLQGNQVFVEDLNSTNSTYLNRQKLQPGQRYLLNSGDELRLGGVVLIFYIA